MKLRTLCTTTLLALAAVPAVAQTYYVAPPEPVYRGEPIYVPGVRPGSSIHGGWVNPGDDQLLGDALAALSAERDLNNVNLTIVAKNGELIVNGVARDSSQAARMERIMKQVAAGRVTTQWTTQLG
jgi:hypothetical protein